VIERLEDAGRSVLCLPHSGHSPHLRTSVWTVVHTAAESYGWQPGRARPAAPGNAALARMDEAFGWLALIPQDRHVLRRIAAARSLVDPLTGRHLFPWRRLGVVLGADHKAVQRWHGQAVGLIVAALAARPGPG
jgi:hypothetical protein